MPNRLTRGLCALAVACMAHHAFGACGDSETWGFDLETEGEDVFWTSPTMIGTTAPRYRGEYELTLVEMDVSWMGIPFGPIDVTEEIPEDFRSGSETLSGPLPITIFNGHLAYPPPPEEPGVEADVEISIDDGGFGQLSITNVVLGDVDVDLGPPFGTQTVTIESIRAAGNVAVTELAPLGDVDGDCIIGFTDLLISLSSWGPCDAGKPCPADLNGDRVVGFADLLPILSNWGEY